jgi:hypothetical protein
MYFTQMAVKTFLVTNKKKKKPKVRKSESWGLFYSHLVCEGGLFIVENVNGAEARYCQISSSYRLIVIPISQFGIYRLTLFIAVEDKLTTWPSCGYTLKVSDDAPVVRFCSDGCMNIIWNSV